MTNLVLAVAIGHSSDLSWLPNSASSPPSTTPPPDSVELRLIGATVEITTAEQGMLEISISGAGDFNGTYTVEPTELALGPVNLVPPLITNTGTIGNTITFREGLWVYTAQDPEPTVSYQWRRDGTAITGETNAFYTIVSADQGSEIDVFETIIGTNGSQNANSNNLPIPATGPSLNVTRLGDFIEQRVSGTSAVLATQFNPSEHEAGDILLVAVGPGQIVTSASLDISGAQAATVEFTENAGGSTRRISVVSYILTAADILIDQAITNLTVNYPGSTADTLASAHIIKGGVIDMVVGDAINNGATVSNSVIPSNTSSNHLLVIATGATGATPITWDNTTETESLDSAAIGRAITLAENTNVSGATTVTATHDANASNALALIMISEAP